MRRAQRRKYHFIYKTTCITTSKFYYGMHSTDNLDDGYLGSGKRLGYSINKHGRKNHICEKLEFFNSREILTKREEEIVNNDLLKDPLCMNLKLGGEGGPCGGNTGWSLMNSNSEIQKIKSYKGHEKIKWLLENDLEWSKKFKEKISSSLKEARKNNNHWIGRKHSLESKTKMSISHKGKNIHNSNFKWVSNDKETKKIKITEIENYLENGWISGRRKIVL